MNQHDNGMVTLHPGCSSGIQVGMMSPTKDCGDEQPDCRLNLWGRKLEDFKHQDMGIFIIQPSKLSMVQPKPMAESDRLAICGNCQILIQTQLYL